MSKELESFNLAFPNSLYREINKRYEGVTNTEEGHKKYQESKSPLNKNILDFASIKNTPNRIGWIVPKEYVVVDIDDMYFAKKVYDILQTRKIKFSFMKGKNGGHFIFKNNRGIGNGAKYQTSIGVLIDTRAMEKGYIILPENDKDREWGKITNDVDDIPFFLTPLKSLKVNDNFSDLKDGDGRNSKLFAHLMNLKDYASEITPEEQVESIRIINTFILREPLSVQEIEKTLLRDSVVKKEGKKEEKGATIESLAEKIVKDYMLMSSNEELYRYNGKYYQPIHEIELERIIHLEYAKTLNEKNRREIIKFCRLKAWVDPSLLNRNWNEIVVNNGILNISEMKLYPHSPAAYNTIFINHNFIDNAPKSGTIDAFFEMLAHENDAKKVLLYEVAGYSLIRKNVFEKFFICYGEGSTGKSTYLGLISKLLGDENVTCLSLQDLTSTFKPAELFGKLANIGDDISAKTIEDSDILKKIISGQPIMTEQKFKQPIKFSNFAKLIYTANRVPTFADRTSGMLRRMMLIEINKKVTNPDIFFLNKITESDYEYLLYKAVVAIRGVLARNAFTTVESVDIALQIFRQSQSSVLSFIDDFKLTPDVLDGEPIMITHAKYTQYCEDSGFRALSRINFAREVSDELKMNVINTTNGANTPQQKRFKK